MKDNSPINFVESIYACLSPFSAHQINIWGENFATAEHAYQSSKFIDCKEREEIKNSKSPILAWQLAQEYKNKKEILNPNFDKDKIMEEIFRAKVAQHFDVLEILKESGNRGLLKVFPTDFYWGTGEDGSGENKMGKLWMKIRKEILI